MMERTWGYASQVGQWSGLVDIPTELLEQSLAATDNVLERFIPVLAEIHRPTTAQVTWVEYDKEDQEVVCYELEEVAIADWKALRRHLQGLAAGTVHRVELHDLFIELDTAVITPYRDSWAEKSATFQISISRPFLRPLSVAASYTTYIDVWLSTTYGEHYKLRSNREAARLNKPRLEAFLRRFAELTGESFRTDLSQLYYFAITPTGFRDVNDLPPVGAP